MIYDNISYLREFIGKDWITSEFEKINKQSLLKGAGTQFAIYHPYVQYMYELKYLILRANIDKNKDVILGQYYHILNNAGYLLRYNFDSIIDKKDAKMKLRNPEQFYDFIWELETRTMFSLCGVKTLFNDPKIHNTNDITAIIDNRPLAVECKNKILDNYKYKTNMMFAHALASKLDNVENIKNKIIEFEFDKGRFEDIKTIVTTIRDKFDVHNYQSVLGLYKIRVLKIPFSTPPQLLMHRENINNLIQLNKVHKSELYSTNPKTNVVISKLLFKIPETNSKLKNLNSVLRKANSQLSAGGVVFLHVPYDTFKDSNRKRIVLCPF